MIASETRDLTLRGTEGFVVESSEGDLGWVEEVWVGDANEPRALAVRTTDGRHGLLPVEDVLAVDREYHWIVVPPEQTLLELDAPHVVNAGDDGGAGRMAASWATTGEEFRAMPRRRRRRIRLLRRRSAAATEREPPLWRAVALLLSSIALIVVVVVFLAFLIPRLVAGGAY